MWFLTNFFKKKQRRNWLIFILATFAALGSGYLWYKFENGQTLVCSLNGCDNVLGSPYAKFLGFPVAAIGFFYYFFLVLVVEIRFFITHRYLEILYSFTLFTGILVVLYLRYLEFFVIKSICEQCWTFSFIPTILILLISLFEVKFPKFNFLENIWEKEKVG